MKEDDWRDMDRAQRARLLGTPLSMQANYCKAVRGHSRAAATRAFCQRCRDYNRDDIGSCSRTACELWHYRPYQDREPEVRKPLGSSAAAGAELRRLIGRSV